MFENSFTVNTISRADIADAIRDFHLKPITAENLKSKIFNGEKLLILKICDQLYLGKEKDYWPLRKALKVTLASHLCGYCSKGAAPDELGGCVKIRDYIHLSHGWYESTKRIDKYSFVKFGLQTVNCEDEHLVIVECEDEQKGSFRAISKDSPIIE